MLVLSDSTLPQNCLRATHRLIQAPQDHQPLAEPEPPGLVRVGWHEVGKVDRSFNMF